MQPCALLKGKNSTWIKGNRLATRGLQWARDARKAEKNPVALSVEEMERFAGDYGPRHITLREGRLYYQRAAGIPAFTARQKHIRS